MKADDLMVFQAHLSIFKWFRDRRAVYLCTLTEVRAGNRQLLPRTWSLMMRRCGYCKQRMRQQITHMENIVRPYSPYLQEHRPCR